MFLTHARSYLNMAFLYAALHTELFEEMQALFFSRFDTMKQKDEIFCRIRLFRDIAESLPAGKKKALAAKFKRIGKSMFQTEAYERLCQEITDSFFDSDSVMSTREKRQIQNLIFMGDHANRTFKHREEFRWLIGFYVVFDYSADRLEYYRTPFKKAILQ